MALALRSIHSLRQLAGSSVRRTVVPHGRTMATSFGKRDLQDAIKQQVPDLTNDQVAKAVDAMLRTIVREVTTGGSVTLPRFGTFEKRHRGARKGRNPSTGAELDIPAKDVVAFSAGSTFKEVVATGKVAVWDAKKATKAPGK